MKGSMMIEDRGSRWAWSPEEGLDPQIVQTVDAFIWKLANRYSRLGHRSGLTLEDLVQEGRVGALEAARKFNPQLGEGCTFLTFAWWSIRNHLQGAIRTGVDVGLPRRDYVARIRTGQDLPQVLHLDHHLFGDAQAPTLGETLADPGDPRETVESQHLQQVVQAALGRLPRRDRRVLERRFGVGGPEESLEEIGTSWHLTRERVRQIEARAKLRLRLVLEERGICA